jgi:hypothetical protein
MLKTAPKTPLLAILRALETDERRNEFADLAGTSRLYLYQLAGCHNRSCRSHLAMSIASASLEMARRYGSDPITMEQLAVMCPLPEKVA